MMSARLRFVALIGISALALGSAALAQDDFIELLRSDLRADKTAVVTLAMELSDEDGGAFWPIYREYELELSRLGDRRLALIKEFAASYESLSDDQANRLSADWFKLQKDRIKLLEKYFKRVEKATSSTVAARWVQVEGQIGLLIDLQLAEQMPLIEKAR